jgi:hypothetical protein
MTRPPTKVEERLAEAAETYADDPERAELIHRARRFKASWLELAEGLTAARKHGTWRRWGWPSFEEYTAKELHLRPETVDKLTGSYAFLQKRAPQVLARDGVRDAIPSYQSIDFLRRAEEQEGAPEEVVDTIRKRVLDEAAPISSIARQFKETVFPVNARERKQRDAAALKNVASRLRDLLADTRAVPRRLAGEVSETLDRLLAALDADNEEEAA